MKVLGLEASTDLASVALWEGEGVVFEETFPSKRSLSADLFPLIWRLLEPVGRVDCIVVGLGPGSYAGVRIAIAAAMGLQAVWGCELVGIPSVAALAGGGDGYHVIGDARRGTWYYTRVEEGVCVEGPLLADSSDVLRAHLGNPGPVEKTTRICSTEVLSVEWGAEVCVPSATLLAGRAAAGIGIVQRTNLEPLYLREAHITKPGCAVDPPGGSARERSSRPLSSGLR
jgi:tRNA threonylcarbamoyladenosine biosynthesis protein TsaB